MQLPQPPGFEEVRRQPEMTMAEFIEKHFAQVTLDGHTFTACLACASLVVPGEQQRHYESAHAFKGF